jgi:hypothetical protein
LTELDLSYESRFSTLTVGPVKGWVFVGAFVAKFKASKKGEFPCPVVSAKANFGRAFRDGKI